MWKVTLGPVPVEENGEYLEYYFEGHLPFVPVAGLSVGPYGSGGSWASVKIRHPEWKFGDIEGPGHFDCSVEADVQGVRIRQAFVDQRWTAHR